MILIVGLGNPGEKYKKNRHNIGFMVLDRLAEKYGLTFKFNKKFNADLAEKEINGEMVYFAKPQTFMNNSGDAVDKIDDYYNIYESDVWVVHDDLDVELGQIRIRKGGSSAGQKGVESVIKALGTEEFVRFRVGIKPKEGQNTPAEDFVLKNFRAEELEMVEEKIKQASEIIEEALEKGVDNTTIR